MAYTFTITEITPQIGLTVNPAAVFTTTQQQVVLNVTETQPQFAITTPANNQFTVNDNGFVFTLTNIDTVVTMTQQPSAMVTLTNAVSTFNIATSATNINVVDGPTVVFTATTQISQIQTENLATIFKGEFTSTDVSIYYRGHIVRYNQNIYVATVEPGARITNPAAPPGNSQWTLVFSQTGLTGWQVDAMEKAYNLGPWVAAATYTLNSFVHHQGYIWTLVNEAGSFNSEPSRANTNWLQIGGQGDQPLFTTSSVQFANLTLNGNLSAVGGVFSNLTVTNRLTAGGIRYPITNGNMGQVLTTNGENEANWADIGAIVTASIRPATRENLGGVIIGPGLNVTVGGVISVNTGTGGALIGWNLTDNLRTNGFSIETGVPPVVSEAFPVPRLEIGSGLRDNMDAALIFDARTTSTSVVRLLADTVRIASGNASVNNPVPYANEIRISNTRTELMGTVVLPGNVTIGSTNTTQITIGNVNVNPFYKIDVNSPLRGGRVSSRGNYFDVYGNIRITGGLLGGITDPGGSGTIVPSDNAPVSVPAGIRFSDNSVLTTAQPYVLTTATNTTLGGIKVGSGLSINAATGVLSVSAVPVELPTADTNVKGGVRLGPSFYIGATPGLGVNETLYLRSANTTRLGGIVLQDPFYMDNGSEELDIRYATTSTKGVVKVGAGLGIDIEGRLYADTNTGTNAVVADGLHGIEIIGNEIRLKAATTSTIGGFRSGGVAVNMVGDELNIQQATTTQLGVIKVGTGLTHDQFSTVSVRPASTTTFGGITLGFGLALDGNGKTYVTVSGTTGTTSTYILPIASTSTLGGVKIGRNITIDPDGTINAESNDTVEQFDLSAESYTNGFNIKHSAGSQTRLQLNNNTLFLETANSGQSMRMFGGQTKLQYNEDTALILANDGVALSHNFHTRLSLAPSNVALQSNSDAYALTLTDINATITNLADPNAAKLILAPAETVLRNNTVIKMQAPDTQFGSLFNSRIYAGVIYNFSGTGPPLLAEGVQYADLTVQRTAYPAYDYGQVIRGSAFGPTVPQDFNNRSLAVDFNS